MEKSSLFHFSNLFSSYFSDLENKLLYRICQILKYFYDDYIANCSQFKSLFIEYEITLHCFPKLTNKVIEKIFQSKAQASKL